MKRTIQDIFFFIFPLSLQLLLWAFIHLAWIESTNYSLLFLLLVVCFLLMISDIYCFFFIIFHLLRKETKKKLKFLLLAILFKPFFIPYYYATKIRNPKTKTVPIIEISLMIIFTILFLVDFFFWIQTPLERKIDLWQTVSFYHMQYQLPEDFVCESIQNTMTCSDQYETFGTSLIYYKKSEINHEDGESYFDTILESYQQESGYQLLSPKIYRVKDQMEYYTTTFRTKIENQSYLFQLSLFENKIDEVYILIQLSSETIKYDDILMNKIENSMKYYHVEILA